MVFYPYETQLVIDADNPNLVLTNSQVTIYDPADTSFANPLALVDLDGLPLSNPLDVSDRGFIPAFQATLPQVMWSGGGYRGYIGSFQGVLTQAQAAASSAAAAAVSAAQAAGQDIPAGGLAGQVLTKNSNADFDTEWADGTGTVTSGDVDGIVGDLVTSGTGETVQALDLRFKKLGIISKDDLPAGSILYVVKVGTSWPARPTARTDIRVIWIGADPDPTIVSSGTGGALNGDLRWVL